MRDQGYKSPPAVWDLACYRFSRASRHGDFCSSESGPPLRATGTVGCRFDPNTGNKRSGGKTLFPHQFRQCLQKSCGHELNLPQTISRPWQFTMIRIGARSDAVTGMVQTIASWLRSASLADKLLHSCLEIAPTTQQKTYAQILPRGFELE